MLKLATMRRKQKKAYLAWLDYVTTKDELTREEALNIIRGQLMMPAEEIDCGLIDKCLDHLQPDRATRTYPTKEPTWQRIMQTYQEKEANRRRKETRRKQRIARPGVAVALLLLLVLAAGSTMAYALGMDVWSHIVSWTEDILSVEIKITDNVARTNQADDPQVEVKTSIFASDFQRTLTNLGFSPELPTWMPDDFTFLSSRIVESASGKKAVSAWFGDTNGRTFSIDIDEVENQGDWNRQVEKSEAEPHNYFIGEGKFKVIENNRRNTMTWLDAPFMITISGDLTKDELLQMADSIFMKGEN